MRLAVLGALLCCPLLCLALPAGAQLPAWERWWTFETEHFRVHHTAGLETLAQRAAAAAELTHARLSEGFLPAPAGRIELVVTDHMDVANGFATPIPRNRIVVFARPPADETGLAHFDDWMHLLVGHELVHIFHLDHAEGAWRSLRRVFGRSPILFPQFFTPSWLIEGLATDLESELTGAGRVHGTHFDMQLRAAALAGELFPIDRVTGVPTRWPGAASIYVYGAHFFDWIGERYGAEARAELISQLGGMTVPFVIDPAARRVLGTSFRVAWDAWRDEVAGEAAVWAERVRAEGWAEPETILPASRLLAHPRHLADGRLVFTRADGRRETHVAALHPDGRTERLASRASTDAVSLDPASGELLWSDLEFRDRVALVSDVFGTRGGTGRHRLTRGARVRDLDTHPAGGMGVAIRGVAGATVPVLVDLGTGEVTDLRPPDLAEHWLQPRWAPDGGRFAVARWRRGEGYDIAVLARDGRVLESFGAFGGVASAPAWSPDGRVVVYAADAEGTMNLYARDLESGADYRLTGLLTGGFHPDVSPDGRWIVFALYGADGYGLARLPFDRAGWRRIDPVAAPYPPPPVLETETSEPVPYRALATALPTSWVPLISAGSDLGFGAGVLAAGSDVIGRHAYSAELTLHPGRGHLDGALSYWFGGWREAAPELSAEQRWSVWRSEPVTAEGDTIGTPILRMDRRITAALTRFRPGVRASWVGRVGADVATTHLRWGDPEVARRANVRLTQPGGSTGAFASLTHTTARRYPSSVSREEGVATSLRLDARRYQVTDAREGGTLGRARMEMRGFLPVDLGAFARHVVGVRLAGGVEGGDVRSGFSLGGAPGEGPALAIAGFEVPAGVGYPVRGYPTGAQVGDRVASGSLEVRMPLAFVERGLGTAPLFLDRLWVAPFLDAGAAWCGAGCPEGWGGHRRPYPLYSTGGELGARVRLFFHADADLRVGIATPLRAGGGRSPGDVELYFRLGQAF